MLTAPPPTRRCPLCDRATGAPICSEDATPTLAVVSCDKPEVGAGALLADRWQLRGLLGEGSYGRVHAAVDTKTGLLCAVKVMRPGHGKLGRRNRVRFAREAAITPILRDPHTVAVLANGQTEGDELFMVLEWLHGESLAERLVPYAQRYEPMPTAEVLKIGLSVLKSLAEAHGHGLVHRDIKPDNIYFHQVGSGELVKLIDFGLARITGSKLTVQGRTLGTPAYMSPEQVTGATVDARSDLYALGCVLYECLATEPPFADHIDANAVMRAHLHEQPEPLAQRFPTVGPLLSAVVMQALAKDPAHRFQDAAAMDKALRQAAPERARSAPNIRMSGPNVMRRPELVSGVTPAELVDVGFSTIRDDEG